MAVLVTLDGRVHDPDVPSVHADDLSVVRGDGVFETLLVRDGSACLVDAHLQRLANSARALDLPAPDAAAWRSAIAVAAQQWADQSVDEAALRLVYTRGRESGSDPTAFITVQPLAPRVAVARSSGVSAVSLQRGLPATGVDEMPWLLAGAKTLSYAVNMSALRHAADQGADDVIFVSTDGYILEGPRSTVVIALEGETPGAPTCLLTPPPWYPILRGTTQQALFEVARDKGYDCDYRALRLSDLFAAQGVWLISAITLGARVHTLDGQALRPPPLAAEFAALVDSALVCDR
jgi:4-amino-4-deoxychorismate lyase